MNVQTLDAAEDRADDLLALWRWRDELSYKIRLARLRFEALGLEAEEQEGIERAVAEFRAVCAYFGGGTA